MLDPGASEAWFHHFDKDQSYRRVAFTKELHWVLRASLVGSIYGLISRIWVIHGWVTDSFKHAPAVHRPLLFAYYDMDIQLVRADCTKTDKAPLSKLMTRIPRSRTQVFRRLD